MGDINNSTTIFLIKDCKLVLKPSRAVLQSVMPETNSRGQIPELCVRHTCPIRSVPGRDGMGILSRCLDLKRCQRV